MNISRLYFPIAHPSFLRRLTFAFRERNDFLKNRQNYFSGYGVPMSIKEFNSVAKKVDDENEASLNSDDFCYNKSLKSIVLDMIEKLGEKGVFGNNTKKILALVEKIDFSIVESISQKEYERE